MVLLAAAAAAAAIQHCRSLSHWKGVGNVGLLHHKAMQQRVYIVSRCASSFPVDEAHNTSWCAYKCLKVKKQHRDE